MTQQSAQARQIMHGLYWI